MFQVKWDLFTVREELGGEVLDAGASRAFAVADHQVAHIYVEDPADIDGVKSMLQEVPGVETTLDSKGKQLIVRRSSLIKWLQVQEIRDNRLLRSSL